LTLHLVALLITGANRYFVGGTVLQRPSLAMLNGVIIGGFGGHCDLFNYTGMLVAVSTTPGVGVTSIYAMEGGISAEPEVDDIFTQRGGKAGIWHGGMGFAVDNSRIFFATGKYFQTGSEADTPLDTLVNSKRMTAIQCHILVGC
jgi:hypothetical protein